MRRLIKLSSEYSYDTLIKCSDKEFMKKLENAQAINGVWYNLSDEKKEQLADKIKKVIDKNKKFIDSLEEDQQTALFNLLREAGLVDNIATQIVEWTKEHPQTKKSDFMEFIDSLEIDFDSIPEILDNGVETNEIKKSEAEVIKRVLSTL